MPPPRSRRNLAMRMKVASNDEVERRGAAPTSHEAELYRSLTLSLAHRRRRPRSLEPIVKRHSQQRSIQVLPCSRAVKVADPTARYHGRVEVVGINSAGVEKAILPVRVVGYAATVGASVIKANSFIPGITHQATSRRLDSNGGRPKVGPQGSISAADGAIADSEGARKAADMNSNSAAMETTGMCRVQTNATNTSNNTGALLASACAQ